MEWGIIPPWIKNRQEATQFRYMYPISYKTKEMELQKILLPKTRFAWKLTHCNFEFKHEHAGENMNIVFKALDERIKNPPSLIEYISNKKSW